MLVIGVLAAVANFAVLTASQDSVGVLVARHPLRAGAPLERTDLRVTELRVDDDTLAGLIRRDDLAAVDGQVVAVDVPEGALVRRADLRPAAAAAGLRRMSVPVPRERAVGGAIAPGDRIDLVRVHDGVPAYLVAGARVVDVADGGGAALGSLDRFAITIEVEAQQALCVAAAIDDDALSVLLSTGQQPVPVTPCVTGPAVPDSASAAGTRGGRP